MRDPNIPTLAKTNVTFRPVLGMGDPPANRHRDSSVVYFSHLSSHFSENTWRLRANLTAPLGVLRRSAKFGMLMPPPKLIETETRI